MQEGRKLDFQKVNVAEHTRARFVATMRPGHLPPITDLGKELERYAASQRFASAWCSMYQSDISKLAEAREVNVALPGS